MPGDAAAASSHCSYYVSLLHLHNKAVVAKDLLSGVSKVTAEYSRYPSVMTGFR